MTLAAGLLFTQMDEDIIFSRQSMEIDNYRDERASRIQIAQPRSRSMNQLLEIVVLEAVPHEYAAAWLAFA